MKHEESTIEKLKVSFKLITYFHIQVLQCLFLEKKDSSLIWYIKKNLWEIRAIRNEHLLFVSIMIIIAF